MPPSSVYTGSFVVPDLVQLVQFTLRYEIRFLFCSISTFKTITFPRQPRDKHKEKALSKEERALRRLPDRCKQLVQSAPSGGGEQQQGQAGGALGFTAASVLPTVLDIIAGCVEATCSSSDAGAAASEAEKNGSGGGILKQLDDDGLATLKAALLGGDGSGLELLEVRKRPFVFGATLRFNKNRLITLPRQARDTHKGKALKTLDRFLAGGRRTDGGGR